MNKLTLAAFALAASFAVQAQQPPAAAVAVKATAPGQAGAATAVEIHARVVGVDKTARMLDLKRPDGNVVTISVGEEVKNFDQIALGDDLVVRYVRALTLSLMKTGSQVREMDVATDTVKAKPGDKPGIATGRQIRAIANVVAINKKQQTVTLKGPRGNQVEILVEDPKQFERVKKGDQVQVVYTEAVAVSVEAQPKKAAAKK